MRGSDYAQTIHARTPVVEEDDQATYAGPSDTTHQAVANNITARAAYADDLETSRVYRRTLGHSSGASMITSHTDKTFWSALSGASLAEISTVIEVTLPVHQSDLNTPKRTDPRHIVDLYKRVKEREERANSELKNKWATMAVLDTQREMMVCELEILTEYVISGKRSTNPLNLNKGTATQLKKFTASLESLKKSYAPEIESLIRIRDELRLEVALIKQR